MCNVQHTQCVDTLETNFHARFMIKNAQRPHKPLQDQNMHLKYKTTHGIKKKKSVSL
jgi:hypothetical protein